MPIADETQLVALVSQGDQSAFAELVSRHLAAIEVYARRMLYDDALAQDVAQETMLVLWQRAGDFNAHKARLTTWLHRVAHNRCIDIIRRRKRDVPLEASEHHDTVAASPDATASVAIDDALRKLPESQRTVLLLTYYQRLSNREVANITNSSVRAVESLLCRARGNLKKQLENQL